MFQIQSTAEFVFSVGDLAEVSQFYTVYGGWEIAYEGQVSRTQLSFWQLPDNCEAQEMLLQFMGNPKGQLRLIQFRNVAQEQIRSGAPVWDTGGILDIDIRVNDIEQAYRAMQDQGWQGISEPVEQAMGPFVLKEVLMKGHDGVIIALVNRTQPPLELPRDKPLASNIYLSAMIVKDLKAAHHFYIDQLGFRVMNELEIVNQAPGPNMFGLPYNLSHQAPAKLELISPDGTREGMLDILQFEGLSGADHSHRAYPPNRGILMYRFPVQNIEAYYEHIQAKGVQPVCPLTEVEVNPYGTVSFFAVQSPDGVWMEFFGI